MKELIFLLIVLSLGIQSFSQGYKNPVIPGFYPDPSICRVGEDFYLVNSSFEYFPGVPVWHSKDLVHWKQIGNVLDRPSQLPLTNAKPSNGIYAPTIRYHKGIFYMVTTLVNGDRGYNNFFVRATNPAGPWSDPIRVSQNGIDPSIFWDDDGKVYFVSNRSTKPTDERAIYQSEIDLKTGKLLSEIRQIWKGSGGSYVEGPHTYKKDGYYYLLTAEGGTAYGHTVAIGRSRNIWGPYESCPYNPILTNRMNYGPIQGTGHGDIVEASDGSWWMVHLAFRPAVSGIHFLGRETCLTPLEWKEGEWPVVNVNGQTEEWIKKDTPNFQVKEALPFKSQVKTEFDQPPGFEWIYLRNPDISNYSLTERKGYLRMMGSATSLYDLESPTMIARRQQHFGFTVTAKLDFNPTRENEEAGITMMMDNRFHYDFYITSTNGSRMLNLRYTLDSLVQVCNRIPLSSGETELVVDGTKTLYSFGVKQKDGLVKNVGHLNTRFLGTEVSGGYNGVIIGLYTTGNGRKCESYADFDWFIYQPKE